MKTLLELSLVYNKGNMKHLLKMLDDKEFVEIKFVITKEDLENFYLQKREDIKTWLITESEDV